MLKGFFSSRLVSTVALLMVPLSACSNLKPTQTTQVDKARDARILTQPEEEVRLEGVQFKSDGATLRGNSKPILDAAAEILRSEPDNVVYVNVYCDRHDSKKATLQLAQQRADSVKAYLETQRIPSEQMIARGAKNSVASTDLSQTRKRTPRVELISFVNQAATTNLAYSSSVPSSSLN